MKELRLLMYEFKRLLHLRKMWLFIAILVFVPILLGTDMFGLGDSYYGTMGNVFILMPAKQSAFVGTLVAMIMTLLEMQRMTKYRMSSIIETATNPLHHQLRQTTAIIMVCILSFLTCICVLLPYTMISMGNTFKLLPFLVCWGIIYFGGIFVTILLASGFFHITRSFDLSFIIISVLIVISFFAVFGSNFLISWVQSNTTMLSDATNSNLQIDVILYTRMVTLIVAFMIYLLGLTCTRRYGKNLVQSILLSCKKIVIPLLTLLLILSSCYFVIYEPFYDKGPVIKYSREVDPDTGIVVYDTDQSSFTVDNTTNHNVEVKKGKVYMTVDTKQRVIKGEATYSIMNLQGREQEVPFTISPGLDFVEVYENGDKIEFKKNNLDNFMSTVYYLKLTSDKQATLRIVYEGSPKSGRDYQMRQWGITDQFVLIPYTFPMSNSDYISVDCTLNLPEKLSPIMQNTVLTEIPSEKEGYKTYQYTSDGYKWLIAGDYNIETVNAGGTDIQFIYLKGKEQVMKDNKSTEVIADVVNFFSDTFGPLDFKGEPFIIAELDTSFVSGGWGLGNMSVFGEAMFAGTVYKGSTESPNAEGGSGIGVAVHEIAHQWWGWSPDSVYVTEDGSSPWSAEGLTVFSSYLYFKERYGEEFAKKEYEDVWINNTKKMQNAFYLTHLEYASKLPENDAADIYTAFANTTRYEMMPYLLLKAEKLVGGEETFLADLKQISQKYRQQPLSYEKFLEELGISKEDMQID